MTYEYKVGDTGKTKGGDDYRVLVVFDAAVDERNTKYVVQIKRFDPSHIFLELYRANGENTISIAPGNFDLVPPKKFVYVNVWMSKTGRSCSHSFTVESAAKWFVTLHPNTNFIAVAIPAEITERKHQEPDSCVIETGGVPQFWPRFTPNIRAKSE